MERRIERNDSTRKMMAVIWSKVRASFLEMVLAIENWDFVCGIKLFVAHVRFCSIIEWKCTQFPGPNSLSVWDKRHCVYRSISFASFWPLRPFYPCKLSLHTQWSLFGLRNIFTALFSSCVACVFFFLFLWLLHELEFIVFPFPSFFVACQQWFLLSFYPNQIPVPKDNSALRTVTGFFFFLLATEYWI